MKIPMLDLKREYEYMKADIAAAIKRCLDHQQWILGPEVKELEEKIARHLSVKHCVGISSGTDALVLALRALAIKRKGKEYFDRTDKVITTPFTFTATGDAILRAGATPVFVDIDPVTFNIDPEKIEAYLSSHQGVVGIIPVHLYGQSCAMDRIMGSAKKYNLFVLEDVAQAMGATYNGQKLGSIGDIGAFSFFPSKNLGGFGDGGMVATNDQELADLVRMLTRHGGKDKYNADHIGYNARLDTLQAAILLAKMKYIDEFNKKRRAIAEIYQQKLQGIQNLGLPAVASTHSSHVYHQLTIRIFKARRDIIQSALKGEGIDTMVYYSIPLHVMKVFQSRSETFGELTEAIKASQEVLSLPIEPLLDPEDILRVCTKMIEFL